MATVIYNESINIEREKANLLCLIKLTLNTLIDQSSSATALPTLDDRNGDVTNFIITLERVLCFRMRAGWISERRFFWDFIRPACIGSCRQSIIERVEDVSHTRNLKDKGRTWIKFALMEKKLSELLKLVISDCHLVKKFYYDDSIMTSSHAFILCDQLAGLNAIDFSFCFKHDGPIIAPILLNDAEIDVIDLTPFLCYKSKHIKQLLKDQNSNEENRQPSSSLTAVNELKTLNPSECEMVSLDKHKLEVEQRKYFEELLRHRDQEFQQLKIRFDTLKGERESEIVQMENIILELQLELRAARDETELKRKKTQQSGSTTPPKNNSLSDHCKPNSPPTPTNDPTDIQKCTSESTLTKTDKITSNLTVENVNQKQFDDFVYPPARSSRHSSQSTTTTNTDDDQYELVRRLPSTTNNDSNQTATEIKPISSPEMLSSATSLSTPSLSSDEDEQKVKTITTTTPEEKKSIIDESIDFSPVK
jgi:hypothetical protein